MPVHINSLVAYHEEITKLSGRKKKIYGHLAMEGPRTDRQVRDELYPGYDMNHVRPRISDLVKGGWLKEIRKIKDDVTSKPVRVIRIVTAEEKYKIDNVEPVQQELLPREKN